MTAAFSAWRIVPCIAGLGYHWKSTLCIISWDRLIFTSPILEGHIVVDC